MLRETVPKVLIDEGFARSASPRLMLYASSCGGWMTGLTGSDDFADYFKDSDREVDDRDRAFRESPGRSRAFRGELRRPGDPDGPAKAPGPTGRSPRCAARPRGSRPVAVPPFAGGFPRPGSPKSCR